MYYVVERSIAIIKPKEPFLEWLNTAFHNISQPLTLDSIRVDCNSYMISEVNDPEEGISYIDNRFEHFFNLELSTWTSDKNIWPKELTLKMFWEWFDVEVFPTVIDLSENENQKADIVENTIH